MTTSTSQEGFLPSHYRSKQEFLASLPPWRRLLSNLNWHPTIDKKVEQYRLEQRTIASEQRLLQLRSESAQIASETEQIRKETEQIRNENERLAELDARIAALWPSLSSNSAPTPPPEGDSPT
jgi:DNA-binding transcriptional regulator GbsR (MarR family)